MENNDDIPTTDTTEIKRIINRVKQGELDSANERSPIWNEGEKRRTCHSRSGRRYSPTRGCAKRCWAASLTALIFIETGTESYRFKQTVAAKKKVKE